MCSPKVGCSNVPYQKAANHPLSKLGRSAGGDAAERQKAGAMPPAMYDPLRSFKLSSAKPQRGNNLCELFVEAGPIHDIVELVRTI